MKKTEKSNNTFLIIVVVLILLIGIMSLFLLTPKKGNGKEIQVEKLEVPENRSTIDNQAIVMLEGKIKTLEQKVKVLEEKIKRTQVTTRTTSKPATPTPTTPETRPAPAPAPAPALSPSPAPVTQPQRANLTDLSHIRDVNGNIIFCVMANNDGGMHFPQYALERGVKFNGVSANTTRDGSNWVVNPIPYMEGDYGVTSDGTFFVRHDILEAVMSEKLQALSIKSTFTNWQDRPMKKVGDFWIYNTK